MPARFRSILVWIPFVLAYVLLDKASFLYAMRGLNITPWNPALALGLMCTLKFGRRTVIPWFLAMLLSDILVRGLPSSLFSTVVQSGFMAFSYGTLAEILRRHVYALGGLTNQRNFVAWLVLVIVGTFLTSCIYLLLLFVTGMIPAEEWRALVLNFWIGDCVGVIVTMPFFWLLLDYRSRLLRLLARWETLGYVILLVSMIGLAFGRWEIDDFKYFHLLFLPLVWAAAAQGLAGAAIAAFVLQAGIILAVQWLQLVTGMVFEMQLMGAVLASVGFFIGVLIDERKRIGAELRQTLRLAAASEMAGALAHEINQPLTALSTYGMVCEQLLARGEMGERLRETIQRMVAESYRAADVVRRLRDFFRTGATRLESVPLRDVMAAASAPFIAKAAKQGVELVVDEAPAGRLLADRLQLEVVLRNLLSNAFDAVVDKPEGRRSVHVSALPEGSGRVCISVVDSGSGLSRADVAQVFEAFHSTKSSGLGLGLAISRAIAEAHGGSLLAEAGDQGVFKLILPMGEKTHDDD